MHTPVERWRVEGFFTKEPGTIRWLTDEIRPGDILYDVGANIGIYALFAAQRGATVYAFEPHVLTAASLIRNILINRLENRVHVLTSALAEEHGFAEFNYKHEDAGSSGSQFGHTLSELGEPFVPVVRELKHGTSLDALCKDNVIPPATLVKIDVDGNELSVLRGMAALLESPACRSLQVECHPVTESAVVALLEAAGWAVTRRHLTALGVEAIERGVSPDKVFANVIFGRRG